MELLDFLLWKVRWVCIWDPLSPALWHWQVRQRSSPGQVGHMRKLVEGSCHQCLVLFGLLFPLLLSLPFFFLPLSPPCYFSFHVSLFFFFSKVSWLFLSLYAVASSPGPKSGANLGSPWWQGLWLLPGPQGVPVEVTTIFPSVVLSRLNVLSRALKAAFFPLSCFNVMVQIRETIPAILSRTGFHMGSWCSQESWKEKLLLREERLQAGLEGRVPDSSAELAS